MNAAAPKENEESEQAETQQPSPAALFSEVAVGLDAGLAAMLAPAGDGACSGRSEEFEDFILCTRYL